MASAAPALQPDAPRVSDAVAFALLRDKARAMFAYNTTSLAGHAVGALVVELVFAEDGVRRLAEIAYQVNEKTQNIGARRLHTVMEKLLEDISFEAGKAGRQKLVIDAAEVIERLGDLAADEELSRYVM